MSQRISCQMCGGRGCRLCQKSTSNYLPSNLDKSHPHSKTGQRSSSKQSSSRPSSSRTFGSTSDRRTAHTASSGQSQEKWEAAAASGASQKSSFTTAYDIKMASRQIHMNKLKGKEREEQEQWAQSKLQSGDLAPCPAGFRWLRSASDEGYRCAARNHFIPDELLAEGKGRCYMRILTTPFLKPPTFPGAEKRQFDGEWWIGPHLFPRITYHPLPRTLGNMPLNNPFMNQTR
ncbi:uncharacterized protein LY89DRAFT_749708 [Mollisia scopiformis]|uniref:Uncharacterized protein n=1 Tax=Mollisia scopiformis TaxID=149040 RepID=A0A194X6K0_MOLSC|nr:uncharacterized protein LY89DRAFT_749708 [Mollisia scopiformis]KUJ15709.1 hypothetical protein LY89DRAFT_749708 [Mollisia scopiformis]